VFFYLSVPFVAGAIMKGLSGTTASLQAGVQNTMQAAGLAVGAGLTAAGAVATLGGSAAVQGALAGTQAASAAGGVAKGGASAAGRIAQDIGSGGGGDVPAPPPIPSVPSASGSSSGSEGGGSTAANPDNPAMVAHQTAPNAFAVVDNEKGTVSQHRGNISTPHTAQAAFNSHAATAQQQGADSPLATRTNSNSSNT